MTNNEFWAKLFQGFRPEDQKLLVVRTVDGLEVAVQNLARIEENLVMVRGRIAGTADNARLFLLPYLQLSGVYVNRIVAMEEVELFSPSVTPERKMEVARIVAEIERKAREEMKDAELAKGMGGPPVEETLKKLEALRDDGVAASANAEAGDAAAPALPAPRGVPARPPALKALPELARR